MSVWEPLNSDIGVFRSDAYPVHEDALRLVRFLRVHAQDRVLDLGTGNGILSIYAEALYGGRFTGIDIDPDAIALAEQSAIRNHRPIEFFCLSVQDAPKYFGHGTFDRLVCNPPYFTDGARGRQALARHGDKTLLSDWFHAAFLLLKNGGTLTLCYPARQLSPLFRALDQNRLAPKRMELIFQNGEARLALIEAKKGGGGGLILTASQG